MMGVMDSQQVYHEVEVEGLLDNSRDVSSDLEHFDFEKDLSPYSERRWAGWTSTIKRQQQQVFAWAAPHASQWIPRSAKHTAQKFLQFLVPSFLRKSSDSSSKPLHETAYLDGLRGFACYSVFLAHHITAYGFEVLHPYGEGPNLHFVKTNWWFQLPIIRLMYNGQASIAVFFVLSGYVLSYKPLKLMHTREFDKLQAVLASSIFRRWLRLFLPVAALWIINIFLVEFGVFDWFTAFRLENPTVPAGFVEEYLPHGENFFATTHNATASFVKFTKATLFIWSSQGHIPIVDAHTWTLHVEFRSSCILFLFIMGTSIMRYNLRLGFTMLSVIFCLYFNDWPIATFLAGSAIADLDLRMRRRQASAPQPETPGLFSNFVEDFTSLPSLERWFRLHREQLAWGFLFFTGLILLSYPVNGAGAVWFYHALRDIKGPKPFQTDLFFWDAVGAMCLVMASGRLRSVQRVLEWPFSQYIGKTSFALYLVHGTVIKSLGYFSVIKTWELLTGDRGWGYGIGILLSLFFAVGPVAIVTADWFWRGVDMQTVRFARWIESSVKDKNI